MTAALALKYDRDPGLEPRAGDIVARNTRGGNGPDRDPHLLLALRAPALRGLPAAVRILRLSGARVLAALGGCGMSWSEQEVAHLRDRWGQDTPRTIALVVGKTRNAVIGKAHRLGLPDLGNPVGGGSREKHAPKPRAPYVRRDATGKPKVTGVKAARLAAKAETVKPVKGSALPAPEPVVAIPSRHEKLHVSDQASPVRIEALERGQCVWPVETASDGHRFCGLAAEPGKPYCADHRAASKGQRSAASMAMGRENARRQALLNRAEREAGRGIIHHGRGWREIR